MNKYGILKFYIGIKEGNVFLRYEKEILMMIEQNCKIKTMGDLICVK